VAADTDIINDVTNGAGIPGFECVDQDDEIDLTEKMAFSSNASASKKRERNTSALLFSSDEDIEVFRLPKRVASRRDSRESVLNPHKPENQQELDTVRIDSSCPLGPVNGDQGVPDSVRNRKKHVRVVENATLLSQGKGLTILIKPTGTNSSTFLRNPVKLARGLRDSAFGKFSEFKVRTNTRRNLMAVEFITISNSNLSSLLEVSKIGIWQVKCTQPGFDSTISGVIGPIHPSVEVSELLETAKSGHVKIAGMVRLPSHRQGVRAESSAVKVIFEGRQLPKEVYIDYLRFPVRPFVLATLRCFRCQGVGHVAGGCSGPRKCLLCAGPHDKSECPHSTGSKRTCANCGGPHSASARECPVIVGARAVDKLRATGLSYADAAKKVRQLPADAVATQGTLTRPAVVKQIPQRQFPPLAERFNPQASGSCPAGPPKLPCTYVTADIHCSQGSYLEPSIECLQHADTPQAQRGLIPTIMTMAGTQDLEPEDQSLTTGSTPRPPNFRSILREELIESECRMENLIAGALREFSMKVGRLLHEAFSLNMAKEGHKERSLLLVSLLRNNFGQAVGDDLLNEWLPSCSPNENCSLPLPELSPPTQSPIIQMAAPLKDLAANCSPKNKNQSASQQKNKNPRVSSFAKRVVPSRSQGNKNSTK